MRIVQKHPMLNTPSKHALPPLIKSFSQHSCPTRKGTIMTFILQMRKKNQDQVNDLSSQIYGEPEA